MGTSCVQAHNSRPQFWGQQLFEGKITKSGGSYLRYYAYRKMVADKMVCVRFLGRGGAKHNLGAAVPRPLPWLRACLCLPSFHRDTERQRATDQHGSILHISR